MWSGVFIVNANKFTVPDVGNQNKKQKKTWISI
jgi:hypothetical protein